MASRSFAQQKAALTRVMKPIRASHQSGAAAPTEAQVQKVLDELRRTVTEWDTMERPFFYGWPDDWVRWQRALNDLPGYLWARLEDI